MNIALRLFIKVAQTLFLLLALGVTFVVGMFIWFGGDVNKKPITLPLVNMAQVDVAVLSKEKNEIPTAFLGTNNLVASNTDGFRDHVDIRLFFVERNLTQKLIKELEENYDYEGQVSNGGEYVTNALCLGITGHNAWTLNADLYQRYFEFCSKAYSSKFQEWVLKTNDERRINIRYYLGSEFFTVMTTN